MPKERLQKILARAGVASRRKAEDLIRQGRVAVDGRVARLGESADPATQVITLDGAPLPPPSTHLYVALNKPAGYLSSRSDPHHHHFIYDLLPPELRHLFPVGRLDRNSEGLLLLTTDGELAHRLMHPRYGVPRVYRVHLRGKQAGLRRLQDGVELEDGPAKPEAVRCLARRRGWLEVEIVLREGRKREIRRMCAAAGLKVHRLKRVAYGPVNLGTLRPGQWRYLRDEEVAALRGLVGLDEHR